MIRTTIFCLCAATLLLPLYGCAGKRRARKARAERIDDRRDAVVEANTRWDKLGERIVTGKADRDVIRVGARDGTFKKIRLEVEHSAIEMFDIVVTFGNGEKFSPGTRLVFGKNTRSRVIDLPGQRRVIKKVAFRYGNLPGGGRAQVELWGWQ